MILGIIPARYGSTRFPGKPLADIDGKTMIRRVVEQASKSKLLSRVIVATDDTRIVQHVTGFGGTCVLTKEEHPSGTDRCREALEKIDKDYDYVINIQGDEPFLDPQQIDELAAVLDGTTQLATQIVQVANTEELYNESEVKVVLNERSEALYFSRQPIPCLKGIPKEKWLDHHIFYRHVGLYAYRSDILRQITELPVSSLERAESLEQLRWLQNGYTIKCAFTKFESHCIDHPEDIAKVASMLRNRTL